MLEITHLHYAVELLGVSIQIPGCLEGKKNLVIGYQSLFSPIGLMTALFL